MEGPAVIHRIQLLLGFMSSLLGVLAILWVDAYGEYGYDGLGTVYCTGTVGVLLVCVGLSLRLHAAWRGARH